MTGSVVDMAPFWWLVAAPAATAVLLAAAYVLAAWKRPALRTPVTSWRRRKARAQARWMADWIQRKYGGTP